MIKPILLAVSGAAETLDELQRDLHQEFGRNFRVLRQHATASSMAKLAELRQGDEPVALLVVDEHLDGAAQLVQEAARLFPEARRVLLASTIEDDALGRTLADLKADTFVPKPWNPPEENLYPVIQDVLGDWRPPYDGIRAIGHRWSPASHQVKDFLGRNGVPYQWLDIEGTPEAKRLIESTGAGEAHLPLLIFPDSSRLEAPTDAHIAEKIGMETRTVTQFYDLIIVGGGPAGLAAAVYGASEGLHTLLIERETPGGQAGLSSHIENYLGFPTGLTGTDLARRGVLQVRRFGAEILDTQEVAGVRVAGPYRVVELAYGTELRCHALIIATGVSWRTLDVPGMDRLIGAGIYYGTAVTEAPACQGVDVFIVGGANSAGEAAVYLARFARTVTILARDDSLSGSAMSQYLIDEIEGTKNIVVRSHAAVVEVRGVSQLEEVVLADTRTGETQPLPATALFIFIGAMPHTDWLQVVVQRDEHGFILSGPGVLRDGKQPTGAPVSAGQPVSGGGGWPLDREPYLLETSVPGVFVAGDARHGSIKRVASAVGEGSIAVQFVHQYLSNVQ